MRVVGGKFQMDNESDNVSLVCPVLLVDVYVLNVLYLFV